MKSKIKITPIKKGLLLQRLTVEESKKSLILIPDSAKPTTQLARVVARGLDVISEIQEGDVVFLGKFSGVETEIEGEQYVITNEDGVFGVVEGIE